VASHGCFSSHQTRSTKSVALLWKPSPQSGELHKYFTNSTAFPRSLYSSSSTRFFVIRIPKPARTGLALLRPDLPRAASANRRDSKSAAVRQKVHRRRPLPGSWICPDDRMARVPQQATRAHASAGRSFPPCSIPFHQQFAERAGRYRPQVCAGQVRRHLPYEVSGSDSGRVDLASAPRKGVIPLGGARLITQDIVLPGRWRPRAVLPPIIGQPAPRAGAYESN